MKIHWPKTKKYTLAQQRQWKKLALYAMKNYPMDKDLHKAVKGCFGAFEDWARKNGSKAKPAARKTASRKTSKRRSVARKSTRRTTPKRRISAKRRSAPKRLTGARRSTRRTVAKRRTARHWTRRAA